MWSALQVRLADTSRCDRQLVSCDQQWGTLSRSRHSPVAVARCANRCKHVYWCLTACRLVSSTEFWVLTVVLLLLLVFSQAPSKVAVSAQLLEQPSVPSDSPQPPGIPSHVLAVSSRASPQSLHSLTRSNPLQLQLQGAQEQHTTVIALFV